jgi:hypothetical protein
MGVVYRMEVEQYKAADIEASGCLGTTGYSRGMSRRGNRVCSICGVFSRDTSTTKINQGRFQNMPNFHMIFQ